MKKALLAVSILLCGLLISNCSSAQRNYVKRRPQPPVIVRPRAPRPGYIWIGPEWNWRGNRYEYVNGYWMAPRVGYSYGQGFWRHDRHGDVWITGGWRR